MMLDLTDEETDALARLLSRTIDDDRYPLSPRVQNLKGILAKIRPELARALAAAEGVRASASDGDQKASGWPLVANGRGQSERYSRKAKMHG
jgi:hypothetical protein